MPAKSTQYANGLLALIFNGTTFPGFGQNVALTPYTKFWLALHYGNPAPDSSQQNNECNYAGYARVSINRDTSAQGWSVSNGKATIGSQLWFPLCLASNGTITATYASVGTASTGPGLMLYAGPITPHIAIYSGVIPILLPGSFVIEL